MRRALSKGRARRSAAGKGARSEDAGRRGRIPAPETLARALAPWFRAAQRDLPWRRTGDPYAIWVSEIMLQQTRVETVRRYYDAFLERFPDVQSLADADESAVLESWSGLGYYRRARLLHRGARHVADAHGGRVPDDPAALRAIPGVGDYTAGALCSIAFDRPEPLVDGNVARVLSRVDAVTDVAQQPATAKGHWGRVRSVLEAGTPRVLAQALMELGATVCTPRSPRCDACPLATDCLARARGLVESIPAPKPKKVSPHDAWWAVAVVSRGRLGFVRRPETGLLAGLWCLPLVADAGTQLDPARLFDVPVAGYAVAQAPVRHVFTHRVWTMRTVLVECPRRPRLPGEEAAWVKIGERPAGGIPALTDKLLSSVDTLRAGPRQRPLPGV